MTDIQDITGLKHCVVVPKFSEQTEGADLKPNHDKYGSGKKSSPDTSDDEDFEGSSSGLGGIPITTTSTGTPMETTTTTLSFKTTTNKYKDEPEIEFIDEVFSQTEKDPTTTKTTTLATTTTRTTTSVPNVEITIVKEEVGESEVDVEIEVVKISNVNQSVDMEVEVDDVFRVQDDVVTTKNNKEMDTPSDEEGDPGNNEPEPNVPKTSSVFQNNKFLAAIIIAACVGLLFAICVIALFAYRMKKKDEGSYALDEQKKSSTSYQYTQGQEYFA